MLGRAAYRIIGPAPSRGRTRATTLSQTASRSLVLFRRFSVKQLPRNQLQEDGIHGLPLRKKGNHLRVPFAKCSFTDFTLGNGGCGIRLEPLTRFLALPPTPPWWGGEAIGLPDYASSVVDQLVSGSWNDVSACISSALAHRPHTPLVFWELLMWQAVRFADENLAEEIHAASTRYLDTPAHLMFIRSLVAARCRDYLAAISNYKKFSSKMVETRSFAYVTASLASSCVVQRDKFAMIVLLDSIVSPPKPEHLQVVDTLPQPSALYYAVQKKSVELFCTYVAAQTSVMCWQVVLEKVAPTVLSKAEVHEVMSAIILVIVEGDMPMREAYVKWCAFANAGVRMSAQCTSALLARLVRHGKLESIWALDVASYIPRLRLGDATEHDICKLLMGLSLFQARVKNGLAAGELIAPTAWQGLLETVLPLDALSLVEDMSVTGDFHVLRAHYLLAASDLPAQRPFLLNSVMDHGYGPSYAKFWGWCNWLSLSSCPRSTLEAYISLLADMKIAGYTARVNLKFLLRTLAHAAARPTLESLFAYRQLEKMARDHLHTSVRPREDLTSVLTSGVQLLDHAKIVVTSLDKMVARDGAVLPDIVEQMVFKFAPASIGEATQLHQEACEEIMACLTRFRGFVPTEFILRCLLRGMAKHRPDVINGLLEEFVRHKIPLGSTLHELAVAAAQDQLMDISSDDVIDFGIRHGTKLLPAQMEEVSAATKPKTNLEKVRRLVKKLRTSGATKLLR